MKKLGKEVADPTFGGTKHGLTPAGAKCVQTKMRKKIARAKERLRRAEYRKTPEYRAAALAAKERRLVELCGEEEQE